MTLKQATAAAIMIALLGCADNHDEAETEATPLSYSDSGSDADKGDAADGDDEVNPEPPSYMGYPCTVDCSGHEAGYQWAEEKGIDDPDDCGGNSNSFIEGCIAYAEQQ